jgi:cytochrome c
MQSAKNAGMFIKFITVIQGGSMKVLLSTIAVTAMLLAGPVSAADADAAKALAQKSGCLACHSIDKKVLGPSYKDVAAKYKGDKTAEAKLVAKVKAGGSGVWGPMPMPANSPQVKDDDIKTIVQWILSM